MGHMLPKPSNVGERRIFARGSNSRAVPIQIQIWTPTQTQTQRQISCWGVLELIMSLAIINAPHTFVISFLSPPQRKEIKFSIEVYIQCIL